MSRFGWSTVVAAIVIAFLLGAYVNRSGPLDRRPPA